MMRRSLPFRTFSSLLAQPEQRLARVIGAPPIVLDGRVLNRSVQALIVAGADLQLADRHGRTPLMLAQARGHAAMVAMLQKAGAR